MKDKTIVYNLFLILKKIKMLSGTVLDKDLRIEKFEYLFDKKDLF